MSRVAILPTIYKAPKPGFPETAAETAAETAGGTWGAGGSAGGTAAETAGGTAFNCYEEQRNGTFPAVPPAPRVFAAVSTAVSANSFGESGLGGPVDGRGNRKSRALGTFCHHRPDRMESPAESGPIHPYRGFVDSGRTRKTISTIAIPGL